MIGPSGPRRFLECLSLSPRNANLGTFNFHEELEVFAMISKSEEHPNVIAGLISLILLVFMGLFEMVKDLIKWDVSWTHSGPFLAGSVPRVDWSFLRDLCSESILCTTIAGGIELSSRDVLLPC